MRGAVIGCGRMGAEPSERMFGKIPNGWLPISHLEALQSVIDSELIAICDTNQDLLQNRSKQYGISKLYTDYRELIDLHQPELITIATRTPAKNEIIQYACRAGVKGIYVEKPLTNSLEELNCIVEVINKYNVKLAYGVNRRYHPVYRLAKNMINEGEIGQIVHVSAEFGQVQLFWGNPHIVDLFLYFLNLADNEFDQIKIQSHILPESIQLQSPYIIDSDPIVENALFKFSSGVTANISRANGLGLRICGSNGNLMVHANGAFVQVSSADAGNPSYFLEQRFINSLPNNTATTTAMTELYDAIKYNKPLAITLKEIEVGTKCLFGCAWSSLNENKIISIDDIPPQMVITGKFGELYA